MGKDHSNLIFDKADYHLEGSFPSGLPAIQAYVHTGMFVAWLAQHGHLADWVMTDFSREIESAITRVGSPIGLYQALGGVFAGDQLNDTGYDFTTTYFDLELGDYIADYEAVFGNEVDNLFEVQPNWVNYSKIEKLLNKRFSEWSQSNNTKQEES